MSAIRRKTIQGLRVGDQFTVQRTFDAHEIEQFAALTRDNNPVHFNEAFYRLKNFPDRICHGLLVAGMLTEVGGQMGWLASEMQFRFLKPVFLNDTVQCKVTIVSISPNGRAEALAIYTNQHGQRVLEAGLKGILPNADETKVLKTLLNATRADAAIKGEQIHHKNTL